DAVGSEYADRPAWREGGRHGPERVRIQEGIGLEQPNTFHAGAPGSSKWRRIAKFAFRQRTCVVVPQPGLEILGRRSPHLDFDTAKAGRNRRFPDTRTWQIGKNAKLGHRHSLFRRVAAKEVVA